MHCPYVCKVHRILYCSNLYPVSPYTRNCTVCLCNTIRGYANLYQFAYPGYNYLYPMVCNNCSKTLKVCVWCRYYRKSICKY